MLGLMYRLLDIIEPKAVANSRSAKLLPIMFPIDMSSSPLRDV
jgi:hypothetical protein